MEPDASPGRAESAFSSAASVTVCPSGGSDCSGASRSVRPVPPFCEMWIDAIAAAGTGHARASSRISRLPADSARMRSSPEGRGRASKTAMSRPWPAARAASVAPTGPAPMTATSRTRLAIEDGVLDVLHALRAIRREDLAPARCHEHVVLDAHADVPELLRHVVRRADVEPRLDGEHHAGLQLAPLALLHVVAGVVDVEAQPVAGAMHVELLVRAVLEHLVHAALSELQVDEAPHQHAPRGLVIAEQVAGRLHLW